MSEGWHGWDDYAPFYDWENAQTLGQRDVRFWQKLAGALPGQVLELGCGTGRITLPVARAGARVVGVDRSAAMLDRARARVRRGRLGRRVRLARADIRRLPFEDRSFPLVMAPYGILQSLIRDRDLTDTLASVHRVLEPGGAFAIDLVPDVPVWQEYRNKVQLRGQRGGARVTLVESVHQDRARRLTVFEQQYIERRGAKRTTHCFTLTFRTLTIARMTRRLERAGFAVDAVLGDYRGSAWQADAETWLILARRS